MFYFLKKIYHKNVNLASTNVSFKLHNTNNVSVSEAGEVEFFYPLCGNSSSAPLRYSEDTCRHE